MTDKQNTYHHIVDLIDSAQQQKNSPTQTKRELNSPKVKMSIFNSNFVVAAIEGNHEIENPDESLFIVWGYNFDGVFTSITCFVHPKVPKSADILFDTLKVLMNE
jgi:hypothetical protein